jgi:hypothetical protein
MFISLINIENDIDIDIENDIENDIDNPFEGTELIDKDEDGKDDRILGTVAGLTGAGAIDLGQNFGYVGDTAGGKVHIFSIREQLTDFDVYPDEVTEVSADIAAVSVVAGVFVGTDPEDGLPIPADDESVVEWHIEEGTGSLSAQESHTENGYAIVTLNTSVIPGDTYKVGAKLKKLVVDGKTKDSENVSALTETVRVVPGNAADITLSKSRSSYAADETDKISLTATVRDQFGNFAADGTPLSWFLEGPGEVPEDDAEAQTADGIAEAFVRSGFLAGNQNITLQADSYEKSETVSVTPVVITLVSDKESLDIHTGETATLTAAFEDGMGNSIADGTRVSWFASSGTISGDSVVSNGTAGAVLDSSEGREDSVLVSAAAGNFVRTLRIPFVSSAPTRITVEHPVIAGDAAEDGTFGIEQPDGSVEQIPYYAKTKIDIQASPSQARSDRKAALWLTAMLPVSSYPFEETAGGTAKIFSVTMTEQSAGPFRIH